MLDIIKPDWPAPPNVYAYVTTRNCGFSIAPYDSFNFATDVGDDVDSVKKNREKLRQEMHLPSEPVWMQQVHSAKVIQLKTNDVFSNCPEFTADAAFTLDPKIVCVVQTADCLPVLLCDRQGTMVGVIHAGWKGLVNGILETTVKAIPIPANNLFAWFGPAISSKAFLVGSDVRDQFVNANAEAALAFQYVQSEKWLANIYLLARQRLLACGVTEIFGGEYCTYTDKDKFFSYRRDGRRTGRMVTLIYFK